MVVWKNVRDIHLMIPEELITEIDAAALELYMSRSEYIRRTLYKAVGGKHPTAIQKATQEDPILFLDINDS